jgi:RND family efflux transporter MFP subunit
MANANVNRAEAENEYAKFELERLEELINRELISLSELERGVRAARVSEASLSNAILSLERAERDLERTKILAPFSGLVKSKKIDLGQFITRGASIANIYSDDYVEVNLPIADQQLAYLNLSITQRGELLDSEAPNVKLFSSYAGKNYEWDGKLVRTEAEIDIRSRMVQTVARIYNNHSNDDYLAPPIGLFVQAEIEGLLVDNIVTMPRSALRGENLVLVVDEEERLYQREINILRLYGDDVFISGGLNQGELICVSPIQTFIDGMKVKAIIEENHGVF